MGVNASIAKKLSLIAQWEDKGWSKGLEKGKVNVEQLKRQAKELAKAFAAVTAALVAGTAALITFIKQGAQIKSVRDSFEGFVRSANMSDNTLQQINETIHGTVKDVEIMQASVGALAAGLEPERLVQFWAMAKQMGDVMSKDTLVVFDGLVAGMTKLEVETLKSVGITLRADDVFNAYAASIGKTSSELTTAERKVAFYNALYEKYINNFYAVGDVTSRNRELFQQAEKKVGDLKDRFMEIVSESPAVQGFLQGIVNKLGDMDKKLDESAPKIEDATARVIAFADGLGRLAGWIGRSSDGLLALGATLVTVKIGGWVVGTLSALGLLSAGALATATAASGWIGVIAGGLIYLVTHYREVLYGFLEIWDEINRIFYGALEGLLAGLATAAEKVSEWTGGMFSGAAEGLRAGQEYFAEQALGTSFIDGIQRKVMDLPKFDLAGALFKPGPDMGFVGPPAPNTPGGLDPNAGKTGPGGGIGELDQARILDEASLEKDLLDQQYIEAEFQKNEKVVEMTHDRLLRILDIERESYDQSGAWLDASMEKEAAAMAFREQLHARTFQSMGKYSSEFYRKGAHMGRVMNAMLIAGTSEYIASYIEAKTEQARFDAMEYAYKAIAAAASGQWTLAAGFAKAGVGAALLGGAGALAAGYIRNYGEQKAGDIMGKEDLSAFDYNSDIEASGSKRQASGVVQQRPMSIVVNSVTKIEAGMIVFPDGSQEAAEQFYRTYTREQIQADLEAGILVA